MPKVRLSGTVSGIKDPRRKERAELLYHLFSEGWDIYNGNGDQTIYLENIQDKILESDAFVFTAGPSLEDYFNMSSVFVGFQTFDKELHGKSAVIVNNDGSWDKFLALMEQLHEFGTIKEKPSQYLTVVNDTPELIKILSLSQQEEIQQHTPQKEPDIKGEIEEVKLSVNQTLKKPEFNVCVFCSASIRKEDYLQEGYDVGVMLAKNGMGCISGAGKTGIMGQVVKGAYEAGGWSAGSNVPHIIQLEGLPEGLNEFWPRRDIYTRMHVMIEQSNAFVIMPGGMGTLQELTALLILKHQKDDLMRGKKIILYNRYDDEHKKKFWNPVLDIITESNGFNKEFEVVESVEDIFRSLKK